MSASGASFEQMLLDALPAHQRYLVAAYAHELAERIRAEMSPESYAYTSGWEDAADLIDPEVSSE